MTNLVAATAIAASLKRDNLVVGVEDERDYNYPEVGVQRPLEQRSNNRIYYPRIEDQLTLGSCTAHATTTGAESISAVFTPNYVQRSRRFNYKWSRFLDGLVGDSGATPRNALKAAQKFGLPDEALWPYDVANYDAAPSAEAMADGANHKLGRYEKIEVTAEDRENPRARLVPLMEDALIKGNRLVIAFEVRRWMFFVNGPLGSAGHQAPAMSNSDPMNDIMGFHMTALADYDRTLHPASGGAFLIPQSWGTGLGEGGWWSFNYMLLPHVREVWVIRGFDGHNVTAAPATPLTPEEVISDWKDLIDLGIAVADPYRMNPVFDLFHYVIWRRLQRKGRTPAQADQVLNLPPGTVADFLTNPANGPRLAAWAALM